jgi:hypothetical protein
MERLAMSISVVRREAGPLGSMSHGAAAHTSVTFAATLLAGVALGRESHCFGIAQGGEGQGDREGGGGGTQTTVDDFFARP